MIVASMPKSETSIRPHDRALCVSPLRDYLAENPALATAVAETAPRLADAIAELRLGLPMPESVKPFAARPYFRPPGSHRSMYYAPSVFPGATEPGRGVIAFKGLEPCVRDFDALLQELRRPCYSPHNMAEHLIFEEHKIPGCVGLSEAIREAERACGIQIAHLDAYGDLAHLPLPLLVCRHSDEMLAQTTEKLRVSLSPAAFHAIAPLLHSGLGIYMYYYPAPVTRARDVDYILQGLNFRARSFALVTKVCDPDDAIRGWVRTFVRMLYLGFLPGSLASLRTGICCQPQNACIDGGFVDLDSLTAIDELPDDTAVNAALQFSAESLIRSVRTLVAGECDPTREESSDVRVDMHCLTQYVLVLIQGALVTESRPQLRLDSRIERYFTPARTFADLVDRLGAYYSPASDFAAAERAFGQSGLVLTQHLFTNRGEN